MRKILITLIAVVAVFAACKKPSFDLTPTGEGIGDFLLRTPASASELVLNAATPDVPVVIEWTAAKPGLSMQPTYTWVAALKSAGNFNAPYLSIPSDNSGKDTRLTLTYKQVDDALQAKGVAAGARVELMWTVIASNETGTKVMSTDQFQVNITRFSDGATPFILLGPASSSANIEINPTSTTDTLRFNWTASTPASAANPVRYRVWFYTDDVAMTPVFSVASNNAGVDTKLEMTAQRFSDSLVAHGFTDPSVAAKLKWRVAATSGNWTQWSDYVNQISILRLVRMYLVGSMNGWDINNPLELIADKLPGRQGKVFYTYVRLAPGDGFKFFKEPGNWGSGYGNNGPSGTGYATGYNVGGDFTGYNGIYRLTIDLGANMAYVQQKQVGLVGGMQGWNPSAPIYGGYVNRDRFIIISENATSQDFKFHDGPAWDNSAPDKARWWGKGANDGDAEIDPGAGNLTANGPTRAIWDGSNPQQVKYMLSPASEMRVVGDGMTGVNAWDPGSSPQMTYTGNGVWTITLPLLANKDIKFVAGNAWGAFDYEDAGAGAGANTRKLKWEGGDNFKTPGTAGTYTITLNEHTQTVTIQ